MKTKFKTTELLVCYWHDITSVDVWIKIDDARIQTPVEVASVGWFLNDDGGCIRLISSLCDDSCNVIVIPKGNIDRIQVVKYNRKNK
jgi:hypothetical protein